MLAYRGGTLVCPPLEPSLAKMSVPRGGGNSPQATVICSICPSLPNPTGGPLNRSHQTTTITKLITQLRQLFWWTRLRLQWPDSDEWRLPALLYGPATIYAGAILDRHSMKPSICSERGTHNGASPDNPLVASCTPFASSGPIVMNGGFPHSSMDWQRYAPARSQIDTR